MAESSADNTAEAPANGMAQDSTNHTAQHAPDVVEHRSHTAPANDLPQCIIASSNRYNDIAPYCAYLFKDRPKTFSQIFPWDFPQNASKEQEEEFLRKYFDETTIHMEGGAHGPGNGFRFLKQAWYCCALWNLEHRAPAVEKWYWEQPDNVELFNDAATKNFFLSYEAKVGTFFKQTEVDLYGTRFLSVVVPLIQNTAKQHLAKEEEDKNREGGLSLAIPTDQTANVTKDGFAMESAPPARQEHLDHSEAKQAAPNHRATLTSTDTPQSEPPPTLPEHGSAQSTNMPQSMAPPPREKPLQQRKRGNSVSKRGNNRGGGHFQGRQPPHHMDRNCQFSPQQYRPPPYMQGYHAPQGPYGPPGITPADFMPQLQQGNQAVNLQYPSQYFPGQYNQPGLMPQHGAPPPPPPGLPAGQVPFYVRNNDASSFKHHGFGEMGLNAGSRSFSDNRPNEGRGNRRLSQDQGQRGGKYRGANTVRGRGRGRDSFKSDDRPPFDPGYRHVQRPSNESAIAGSHARGRRDSMHAANWRSNSEHPQAPFQPPQQMKENVAPVPPHHTFGYQHPQFGPRQFEPLPGSLSYQPKPEMMGPPHVMRDDSIAPSRNTSSEYGAPPREYVRKYRTPGMVCNKSTIGPECIFIKKLVLFGAPADIPEEDLANILSQWSPVSNVSRSGNTTAQYEFPLVFVHFANHHQARQFLERKPPTWLQDLPLRVEVAREYWDPEHDRYHWYGKPIPPGYDVDATGALVPSGPLRGPPAPFPSANTPTVLRRPEHGDLPPLDAADLEPTAGGIQSRDTTPTPSGASTPKRKTKNKSAKKKKADDLRKASLAAAADLAQTAESRDESSNATSASQETLQESKLPMNPATGRKAEPENFNVRAMPNERSCSVATEGQSSQEPSFQPTEALQTRLPHKTEAVNETGSQSDLPSTTSQQQAPKQLDAQAETFRASQAEQTEEVKAQAEDVGRPTTKASDKEASSTTAAAESATNAEEERVDDSFHTASGSPDSTKQERAQLDSSISATESPVVEQEGGDKLGSGPQVAQTTDSGTFSSSAETVSPKTLKKAPIPQVGSKWKVTTSASGSEVKSDTTDQQPTSSSGSILPAPASVTVSETPSTGNEKPVEDQPVPDAAKAEIIPAKKTEKSKGPAQTQSFSLYGKKNEKKAKSGKRGTIKGKPASFATSEPSSRAVSGATTPTPSIDSVLQGDRSRRGSREEDESLMPCKTNESKNSVDERKIGDDANDRSKENVPPPQQETPSKQRGKLGNLFSGLFSGGARSQPSSKTQSSFLDSSESSALTVSKAHDRHQGTDTQATQPIDPVPSGANVIDTVEQIGRTADSAITSTAASNGIASVAGVDGSATGDMLLTDRTQHPSESALGLGISSNISELSDDGAPATGTKRKKKPKKRKAQSPAGQLKIDIDSGPSNIKRDNLTEVFRFGESLNSPPASISSPPAIVTQVDDHISEASSQTMGPDTSTSDLLPPSPQSAKKLPPRSAAASHLMEAKQPSWKQRHGKRIPSRAVQDTPEEVEEEPEEIRELQLLPTADDGSTVSISGRNGGRLEFGPKRERVFVYVGAPLKDEIVEGAAEVDQSRERLRELAMEELRRRERSG